MKEWVEKVIEGFKKDKKHSLLILVLVGVLILIIAWPVGSSKDKDSSHTGGASGSAQNGDSSGSDNSGTGAASGDRSGSSDGSAGGYTGANAAADGYGLTGGETLEQYVAAQEERLRALLSKIKGAGEVDVMITARATREKVVEKDVTRNSSNVSETDSNGGSRTTSESSYGETTLYAGGGSGAGSGTSGGSGTAETSGSAMPYVVKELVPEIEGVVVAASGADDKYIIDEITQSVSVLFNLPVHKIKVVKMDS